MVCRACLGAWGGTVSVALLCSTDMQCHVMINLFGVAVRKIGSKKACLGGC